MKNKVLIDVYVAALDEHYNIYVPVGSKVGQIVNLIIKAINDLSDYDCFADGYCIMDVNTGKFYDLNKTIKETDIRNDKRLIIFGLGRA